MSSNILKLNHDKTELIVFAPKPEMNSLWKFLRKMFRLIFLELLIVILCKGITVMTKIMASANFTDWLGKNTVQPGP
jgi:hypothetical protein